MDEDLRNTGVQIQESAIQKLDEIADNHGVTRSAAIRAAIDTGLRARKYYPDELSLEPERFHRQTIAEQKAERARD